MNRVRDTAAGLWPDFYVALLVGVLAFASLLDTKAGIGVSIGKILGGAVGISFLAAMLFGSCVLGVAVAVRRASIASQASGWLSVGMAVNGVALFANDPSTGSKLALAAYLGFALLLTNRCIVLARAIVLPTWLNEAIRVERERQLR